jgi:hypothetical protein
LSPGTVVECHLQLGIRAGRSQLLHSNYKTSVKFTCLCIDACMQQEMLYRSCVRWPPTFGMPKHSISPTKRRFSVTSSLQDLADARVSLTGHAKAMPEERQDAVRSLYKSKNADSFWADFGDFKPFYMEDIVAVHFNGGFGRAGRKVSSSATASVVHCLHYHVYL